VESTDGRCIRGKPNVTVLKKGIFMIELEEMVDLVLLLKKEISENCDRIGVVSKIVGPLNLSANG
jgi:hypothetical protein